jgi:hypothetical protein
MQLNDHQTATLKAWIDQGVSLSDIQKKISQEWGLAFRYMDLRLLIDDLALSFPHPEDKAEPTEQKEKKEEPVLGAVSVELDPITSPSCLASGTVSFSDGATCKWQLDGLGRLAIIPHQKGYKPPADDMPRFQEALQSKLQNRLF